MAHRMEMRCPVLDEGGDQCEGVVEVSYTPGEPATWFYPGSPKEFEIEKASCKHEFEIERYWRDAVWEEIADCERMALEMEADRRLEDYEWEREMRQRAEEELYGRE